MKLSIYTCLLIFHFSFIILLIFLSIDIFVNLSLCLFIVKRSESELNVTV